MVTFLHQYGHPLMQARTRESCLYSEPHLCQHNSESTHSTVSKVGLYFPAALLTSILRKNCFETWLQVVYTL